MKADELARVARTMPRSPAFLQMDRSDGQIPQSTPSERCSVASGLGLSASGPRHMRNKQEATPLLDSPIAPCLPLLGACLYAAAFVRRLLALCQT